MNPDGTPIEGAEQVESGAGGGEQRATATEKEARELHESLGIKSTFTSDKSKKRPKAANVRDKDVSKKEDDDSDDGRKPKSRSDSKPKDAPDSDKDGDSGNDNSPKKSQKREEDGKVHGESEEAGEGVHKAESRTEKDSEQGGEGDADDTAPGTRQAADDEGDAEEEGEEDGQGKRPGKSNPKIEQRFQKLNSDLKERDDVIAELQQKLQEATQQQRQEKIDAEDPVYEVEDFKKVRNEKGEILELDDDQAELAFRRWQDGYNQRKAERDAKYNQEMSLQEAQQQYQQEQMQKSVEAYDTLTSILENYEELDVRSDKFDQELSDAVMPIIQDVIIYQEGTEPGNEEGNQPVIVGMSMNPAKMLDVINKIRNTQRTLPLNGINDNVESRSNVSVPHSRSSDPTVNQANQLMKELKINKRF